MLCQQGGRVRVPRSRAVPGTWNPSLRLKRPIYIFIKAHLYCPSSSLVVFLHFNLYVYILFSTSKVIVHSSSTIGRKKQVSRHYVLSFLLTLDIKRRMLMLINEISCHTLHISPTMKQTHNQHNNIFFYPYIF